jgi:hypothetical protein
VKAESALELDCYAEDSHIGTAAAVGGYEFATRAVNVIVTEHYDQ